MAWKNAAVAPAMKSQLLPFRQEKDAIMLVLSRKSNESIIINNNITVTVVEIRGDKVRLGIVAPKDIPVHRQEVYDLIHGKKSADGGPSTSKA